MIAKAAPGMIATSTMKTAYRVSDFNVLRRLFSMHGFNGVAAYWYKDRKDMFVKCFVEENTVSFRNTEHVLWFYNYWTLNGRIVIFRLAKILTFGDIPQYRTPTFTQNAAVYGQ